MSMFRFEHSEFLWLLLAVPVWLIVAYGYHLWRKKVLKTQVSPELLAFVSPAYSSAKKTIKTTLFIASYALLVIALSNPQLGSKLEEVKREGIDLVICLDVSNSMLAEDLSPNRLERAKRAMSQLVDRLKGDRLGIVVFAGDAFVQLPITVDYAAAKLFLGTVNTNTIATQGTNIGIAIRKAMSSFDMESPSSKAIVVITDGENHEEGAIDAAEEAAKLGVQTFTIGMGSDKGAPIPVYRGKQQIGYKKDNNGNTVVTSLNEAMLVELASIGNGEFIRATNANAGLEYIVEQLGKLEKTELESKVFTDYEDRFQYPLGLSLLMLLIFTTIGDQKSSWSKKINEWTDEN